MTGHTEGIHEELERIQWRTHDGKPIAREHPHGTVVLVYSWREGVPEFLVLHRANQGPEYEGDWAWTPPSGARYPGESVDACARRELMEETGLELDLIETDCGQLWPVYLAELPEDAEIVLSDEHDRYLWVEAAEAMRLCLPSVVAEPFGRVVKLLGERS